MLPMTRVPRRSALRITGGCCCPRDLFEFLVELPNWRELPRLSVSPYQSAERPVLWILPGIFIVGTPARRDWLFGVPNWYKFLSFLPKLSTVK